LEDGLRRRPIAAIEWFLIGERSDDAFEATTWRNLKISCTVYFAVLILVYEVAVAVRIFQGPLPDIDDIDQLNGRLDIKRLGVTRGSASETLLRAYLDKPYPDPAKIPWKRVEFLPKTIEMLRNKEIDSIFTFDDFGKFAISKKGLCDKVRAMPLNKFETGGWIYSANIPKTAVDSMDYLLLNLRLRRVPTLAIAKYIRLPKDCASEPRNVDSKVMLLFLIFSVLPMILFSIAWFIATYIRRCLRRRRRQSITITPERPLITVVIDHLIPSYKKD